MKVLITGGAGYIGTELTKALSDSEQISEVIVYDNLSRQNYNFFSSYKLSSEKVHFVHGDILNVRCLKKYLPGVNVVFHLAAKNQPVNEKTDIHHYDQVNHWGTAELIYALEETGVNADLVFLSDIAVYGYSDKEFDESSPLSPQSVYADSKLNAETHVQRLINRKSSNIKAWIFRVGTVYGYSPAIRYDTVINKFALESHFENRISIHGSGRQFRSFIFVNNIISVLLSVINGRIDSGVYNLIQRNLQINDIVETLKEIYTDLEFIFINQNYTLDSRMVNPHNALYPLFTNTESSLKEDLLSFKSYFSF